ncbi:MAG TPA: HEAT repeat domain-containing protein [Vicinamibacteria bacterium]|nr:HEAT repeat domain-containing protein [Vicinamibacteria bacterium]
MRRRFSAALGLGSSIFLGVALALAQSSFHDEVANLRSPNVGTRVKAAKALGKSGRPEAIPALTEAMRDPEAKVRKVTVEVLRGFNSTEAIDGLLVGLRDEEKSIREEAMVGLLEIYVGAGNASLGGALSFLIGPRSQTPRLEGLLAVDPRVVTAFEASLQDGESGLRRRAAYSLGALGAQDAVDSLGAALYDPDKDVRLAIVEALGAIGTDEAGEALRALLKDHPTDLTGPVVDSLGAMRYLPAAPELVSIYDSNVNKLGDRALAALARMGAPEARGVFYYQMTSQNAHQRRWAVEGLGRLDDPALVPGLMKDFLREPDPSVQLAYCFSLARLGRAEFIDRVALSLADKQLREQAHQYAVELGSPLLEELVTYLSDPVAEVRKEMALVLMHIGDPAAIPHLEPLLSDPDGEVADRANRAIAHLQQGRRSASSTNP